MGKTYPGGTATRASIIRYDTKRIDHRPTGLNILSVKKYPDNGIFATFASATLQGRVKFPIGGKVREPSGARTVGITVPTAMLAKIAG